MNEVTIARANHLCARFFYKYTRDIRDEAFFTFSFSNDSAKFDMFILNDEKKFKKGLKYSR